MHFDLVIISNLPVPVEKLKNINYCVYDESTFLQNHYQTSNHITFDYVIVSNPKTLTKIEVLKDFDKIITNQYFQTSIEHIFVVGDYNQSCLSIERQWESIISFLLSGE
jgi:thioredoxin reductase